MAGWVAACSPIGSRRSKNRNGRPFEPHDSATVLHERARLWKCNHMKENVDVGTGGVEPQSDHVGLIERCLEPLASRVVPVHAPIVT